MALLGESTVTRRRRDGGAWTAGRWVRGAAVDVSFTASVQRLSGRDRQVVGAGDRARADRKLLTEQLGFLRTEDQYNTLEADEVVVGGVAYTVVHVDDEHPEIPYENVFLVRTNEASSGTEDADLVAMLDNARDWLIGVNALASVTVPVAGVIFGDQNGPRPPLPYVVLDIEAYDERVGYDDQRMVTAGTVEVRGQRRGTLVAEAYGEGALDWLERAVFLLTTGESLALLTRMWLEPVGPLVDLSATLDSDTETRYRREFVITYTRVADPAEALPATELEEVVHTDTFGDRTVVVTEDLT